MVSSNLVLPLFFLVINRLALWRKWTRARLTWLGGKSEERFKLDRNGRPISSGEKSNLHASWINCLPVSPETHSILQYHRTFLFTEQATILRLSYFTATASPATTPLQVNNETTSKVTEKPYTELSVTVPSEVTKSLETSRKPVLVNIKGENGNPVLADEKTKKAPMVETIVVKLPANIKAEDENAAEIKIKGPAKGHINATMSHGTTILEIPEGIYIYIYWEEGCYCYTF